MIILMIFTILCTNLIINCFPATGVSTIKVGDQLNVTSRLVSSGSNFTLGFFTIPSTNYTYLGIWYTNDDQLRRVWIANPSTPIVSTSHQVLMIDPDTRKLVISDGGTTLVNISDNQYYSSLAASLEDSGNFQLKNETDNRVIWQSFDHPSNVLLPGMKLGSDLKTGQTWNLTSWVSDDIPDSGAFTLSWEPNGENSQRFMVRRRGQPYWTSGDLRNQEFEFMSVNTLLFSRYNISYVYNDEERYFSFDSVNYLRPMWILRPQGRIVDGKDRRLISTPDLCYGYDLGNGCIASSNIPSCRNAQDKFSPMSGDFDPDMTSSSFDGNSSLSISDCMVRCWNDCECLGFISSSSNGTGCLRWTGTKSAGNFSIDSQGNSVSKYVLIASDMSKGKARIWIWALIGGAGIFVLFFCFGLLWCLKKRKLSREEERKIKDDVDFLDTMDSERFEDASDLDTDRRKGSDLVVFSFASIVTATDEFSSENKLGQGGFGPVYKGKLSDKREIAIKRLSRTSGQGNVEFKNELVLIAKLQHTNLVRVLGCCTHGEEKMLIYEYMPNKSLDYFLFDETKKTMLDWPKRWNIIEGIAQGLLYLHKYSRLRVIHRDLKASNVLLDGSMNPKISDFGMARIFKHNETEAITKRVVGTFGYMSPEYAMEGTFSEKSDVFSFGVLILEIVSGRRNSRFSHRDEMITLVGYAWELWQQGDALQLQDPTLSGTCVINQLSRTIHVALLCVQENAVDRPVKSDVISMLINDTTSLHPPKRPPFFFHGAASASTNSSEIKLNDHSVSKMTVTEMEAR